VRSILTVSHEKIKQWIALVNGRGGEGVDLLEKGLGCTLPE
jgi:hypothetical protein